MRDTIKQFALIGIGLASLTKEKVEELAKDISESSKLSEEEGRNLIDEIINESKDARGKLDERVNSMVKKSLDKLNIPSREELEKLKSEISELRAQVSVMEGQQSKQKP